MDLSENQSVAIDRKPNDPDNSQLTALKESSTEEEEVKSQNDADATQENNNESPKTFPSKYSIPKKNQETDNADDKPLSETPTEACKLFVGGLTTNTTEAMLRDFYSAFGRVVDVVVMVDSPTGRSRCFGFVTFAEPEHADRAIAAKPHVIDNRTIDAKRAIPREVSASNPEMKVQTTRLFVPGVRDEHTEENLQAYFEKYGKVKSVVIRRDKLCAFVDFEDADPVTKCALERAHYIEGHRCDVKKALSRDELTAARQRDRDRGFRGERQRGSAFGGRGGGVQYGGRDRDGGRSGGHFRGNDWRSDRGPQRGNYQQHEYGGGNAGYGSGGAPCSSRNSGGYGGWKETRGYEGYGSQNDAYFSGPQVQRQQENIAIPPGYNGPITHIYQASFAAQSSPAGGSRGLWANPAHNQHQASDFAARPVYQPQYRPYPDQLIGPCLAFYFGAYSNPQSGVTAYLLASLTFKKTKMALRFDGRVVIVTGAGGGLGRTYALDFAQRGASVVVNDLGGEAHGTGASTSMADKVVKEIRAAGGKAVANYDSVEYGEKIVKTAIDNFGRVDVVVNNAGILRDKAFVNMTDEDWDLIHKVHLKGAYSVARAAWPYMRKEKYGRIINTSSNSGVYGSFGQANYSAAKMGLVGFSNTLALEGAKYNILANSLVPTAGSRLTQTVMPQDLVDALKPEFVTPLVVYLCHESCPESGKVFEAGAGWFGTIQYYRSKGLALGLTTAEAVRDNWSKIVDMSHAKNFPGGREVTASLMEAMANVPEKKSPRPAGSTDKMDPQLAKSYVPDEPETYSYTARDAIIYALGIGATTKPEDVKFIYEGAEDFSVFPTFVVAPGLLANSINDWPGVKFDLQRVLHGEQYIELLKPLPSDGELKSHTRVVDIVDKGSFALILTNVETYDAQTGEKLAVQQFATFEKGFGNFGGSRTSAAEKTILPVPKRSPDAVVEQQTSPDQAALYRQGSGDMNPLHVDTDFAKVSGFKQPILHGLCSLGFAVRHVLQQYANNDVNRFKAVKVRFSKPVIPGQTLRTEMWKEGDRIHFQTLVKETGETVLSSCYVDLKPGTSTGHTHAAKASSTSTTSSNVKSAEIFKEMGERLKSQPDVPKKVQAILLYVIKQGGKDVAQFTVDLKNGAGAVYEGAPKNDEKAATTMTVEDEDFVKLATGKLNPQQAFMSGKIKVKGNIMLLQKLQGLMAAQKAKL
uniref:Peroxisomal multifunctional enzyme type 2 n=1 Tax=Plectus sambesii TaxID=2011161 RepID=A0A914XJV9_9BILA